MARHYSQSKQVATGKCAPQIFIYKSTKREEAMSKPITQEKVSDNRKIPDHKWSKGKFSMRNTQMRGELFQFLRFCAVGTSNAVIDFGVLNFLLWMYPTSDYWRTLAYNSLAVLLAATNSFFWNKYWTFQQHHRVTRQEVLRFVVVTSATIVMNDLLMSLLALLFPHLMSSSLIGANVLKLAAIIGTMSVSFFGMRLWVFFQRGHGRSAENNLLTTSLVMAAVHVSELPTVKVKTWDQREMKTPIMPTGDVVPQPTLSPQDRRQEAIDLAAKPTTVPGITGMEVMLPDATALPITPLPDTDLRHIPSRAIRPIRLEAI
jgi:putative flippase GtrA